MRRSPENDSQPGLRQAPKSSLLKDCRAGAPFPPAQFRTGPCLPEPDLRVPFPPPCHTEPFPPEPDLRARCPPARCRTGPFPPEPDLRARCPPAPFPPGPERRALPRVQDRPG